MIAENSKTEIKRKANMVAKNDLEEIRKLLDSCENQIRAIKSKLFASEINKKATLLETEDDGEVIQGVFDGEKMISSDKKTYQVPPNYASKSKLIEGDILKLTISEDGKFVYKQIGPVPRKNLIGTLEETGDGEYQVDVEGKKYKVLLASVTYFKAKTGDSLGIIVPKDQESVWAAVDNLI
ncbi:MAG: hypothetical protein WC080_03855 [Patescibacteria group bacterium]